MKGIVNSLLEQGFLVSPDALQSIQDAQTVGSLIKSKILSKEFLIINKDIITILEEEPNLAANWLEFEKLKSEAEKTRVDSLYKKFLSLIRQEKKGAVQDLRVVFSYEETPKKIEVQDFVNLFLSRYRKLERLLNQRTELTNLISISRIITKKEKETVSLIGIVSGKHHTKNGNLVLTMEDPTATIKVMVNKTKPELYDHAKDITLDEVIGITGVSSDKIVFANTIVWPEIPRDRELRKSKEESYAVFLSDLHVGSKKFLKEEFNKFLSWINQETGSKEQREIAAKVKYLFFVGDMVDGVGIYPNQENELETNDIYKQYEECAELLAKIPPRIKIIICAGNHDAMRISEPQLQLYKDFSRPLWQLQNVEMVSNPAILNIGGCDDFAGFDVLLYHGYSFDYYIANIDSIRNNGGYDKPELVMKYLLKRRHLAPSHASTLYMPDPKGDFLVIEKVPDFFVAGHIHKSAVANYRGVTMICGSCWQSKTEFQEKVGHHPEPCRVPIVNLHTRNVKILRFGD
ncbi:MAG: DNA-directed DNA polymerase II small subunit [Candidatus Woesearchaeota archaeon]